MSTHISPPVNHVFLDYENVRRIDSEVVGRKSFSLQIFLGPQNTRLDVEMVRSLLAHSQMVKLVRSPRSGNNALDFVLAFHLGQAVLMDPTGFFHIISKDEGFDSLVELLKERHVKIRRHPDWASLDAALAVKSPSPPAVNGNADGSSNGNANGSGSSGGQVSNGHPLSPAAAKMLESLRKSPRNRPKKRQTLVNHAGGFVGKEAGAKTAEVVVRELERAGRLVFDDQGKVSYRV